MTTSCIENEIAFRLARVARISYDSAFWHVHQALPYIHVPDDSDVTAELSFERLLEFWSEEELIENGQW